MPLRLSPDGLFMVAFDPVARKWKRTGVRTLCPWWNANLEVQPGVKAGALFDLVEEDEQAARFLAAACWCNVEELHESQRGQTETFESDWFGLAPEQVKAIKAGRLRQMPEGLESLPAEFVAVQRELSVGTEDGQDYVSGCALLSAGRFDSELKEVNFVQRRMHLGIRDLELLVSSTVEVDGVGPEVTERDMPITLGEVLMVVYSAFGRAPDFNETEAQRRTFDEIQERLRELMPDDADWWKRPEDENGHEEPSA